MDILKLRTHAGKKLLSSIIARFLSKKMNCVVRIWLDELEITHADGDDARITFSGKVTLPIDKISIF